VASEADLTIGGQEPSLTEALDDALDKLEEARTENEQLQLTTDELAQALADRERQIRDMQDEITACRTRIKGLEDALEAWKADVLGFREEMRDYEEAEMQVLQEMVLLLRGFKVQKQTQETGGRS
jgi:chromosome segregation ATPase